ncbi:hypothetical protein OEZ86_000595 [Tetradesmus obliquus]|nr:hypothetical protein OEZ86_000595 [Tetradesmus obliquus]
MQALPEQAVPALFSTAADGNTKCQLRLLDNFTIHEAGKPQAFVALEALRSSSRPVATGELLPAKSTDAGAGRIAVATGPVRDWCLEYGEHPAVWIMTEMAWYRLCTPSHAYVGTYRDVHHPSSAPACGVLVVLCSWQQQS